MKVILQKTVERLGDPGDVADVADGYARNFLIPRGLAVRAEKGTVRHAESLKRAHRSRTIAQKGEFEEASERRRLVRLCEILETIAAAVERQREDAAHAQTNGRVRPGSADES